MSGVQLNVHDVTKITLTRMTDHGSFHVLEFKFETKDGAFHNIMAFADTADALDIQTPKKQKETSECR